MLLIGGGFTDAWRHQYPDVTGYTYWNFKYNTRANNKGWRLDYFLVWPRRGRRTLLLAQSLTPMLTEIWLPSI